MAAQRATAVPKAESKAVVNPHLGYAMAASWWLTDKRFTRIRESD